MNEQTEVQQWFTEIGYGLEYRRRFGLEDLWGTFESIYYNVNENMLNDGPNIFLSQGDAMLSMLTVPSPRIRVRPTTPEEVDRAPFVESIDNKLLSELELTQEIEDAALHAYLFGRGILKFGYDSEWGYAPDYDIGGEAQLGLTFTQLDKQGKKRIEYNSQVIPGMPWCKAVMPHDIIVPWGTKELKDAPWVIHRVVRHIDDLRADQKYNTRGKLEPTLSIEDFVNSYRTTQKWRMNNNTNTRTRDHVELYEIHDRKTGKIKVIARGHDKFLRNENNALQIDNVLPFTSMTFTPTTRAFWTTPDVFYLYHVQNELSDVARQRTKQRRISTLKFLYNEDVISEAELEKILSPDVGAAAKVNAGQRLAEAITKIDNAPNQLLAQEEELLRANAREQIGFSRNQLGEYTGGRKTATEVGAVESSSRLRMSRRGVQIKRLYEQSFRVINGIIFSYWTLPRFAEVIGPQSGQQWARINGPAIKGRYAYNVEFVEAGELQARKLEALQLYGMLSQDPSIDPTELRNYLSSQVNDPAFERLFNADVRNAMSQLQQNGGAVQGNRQSRQPASVSFLQNRDGQGNLGSTSRLLAGGGSNP